jgi:FkbM family methyltransferase
VTGLRRLAGVAARAGGWVLRAVPPLERPVFGLLRASDARLFRSARFRLWKAWAAGLPAARAVRLVTLPGGVRMAVDVRDWCGITYIEPGAIEPATTAGLLDRLRPGDVFVDIGANVGYMTLRVAPRVGPTGAVWCFEPNPRLVGLIGESVRHNGFGGWVHPVPLALAEADAPARPFYLSEEPTNSGLSSLVPDAPHQELGRMNMAAPTSVRVATFDTFAAEHGIDRVDVVKIDVEGAEHLVVEGMRGTLARLRPRAIVCETAVDSPAARALEALGYRGRMLEVPDPAVRWGNVLFEPDGAGR